MKFIVLKIIPIIVILMVMLLIVYGFPMEGNQFRTSPTRPSTSKATKGVEKMSETKYRCVQGMLHCKVLANKIGIQYQTFPSHFHSQTMSERLITSNNVNIHKQNIDKHREMIKENRNIRSKAKSGKDIDATGPDSYLSFGVSP